MSTIKSSDEHLTLNADGSSKDIKFQANGVEKASISSSGAFTSTTIDATKLTGALPAISGAALTGVGVAGITSAADATAITIDSSEKVGIGTTSPDEKLDVEGTIQISRTASYNATWKQFISHNNSSYHGSLYFDGSLSTGSILFRPNGVEKFAIMADGRGLSQFTAKAWLAYNGNNNTVSDSHNISSVTDNSAGNYTMNFSNNMANTTYVSTGCAPNNNDTTDGSFIMAITNNVGSCKIIAHKHNGTNNDRDRVQVITFGD